MYKSMIAKEINKQHIDNNFGSNSLHSPRSTQGLFHESLLGKAGPPLAGFTIGGVKHLLTNSGS